METISDYSTKVSLGRSQASKHQPDGTGTYLKVEYRNATRSFCKNLEISLRRTIRVPDNGKPYELPPDMGGFPLYSVNKYKSRLPAEIANKGGVFIPIYQREALWIDFRANHLFAVKIFVGGINAISGEPRNENTSTLLRRKALLSEGRSIQDYVVAPKQYWLDGIAQQDGKVRQFVAVPFGDGYSVEAQLTGHDFVGGIQFEVVPARQSGDIIKVVVEGSSEMTRNRKPVWFEGRKTAKLGRLMLGYAEKEKLDLKKLRFIYNQERLKPDDTLEGRGIYNGATIYAAWEQIGGGGCCSTARPKAPKVTEMAVAPGGLIKQTIVEDFVSPENWDLPNAVLFNVNLINAGIFEKVTGVKPPPTPITAETYAAYNYPFFELYEEPTGILGSSNDIKSVAERDKAMGNMSVHEAEEKLDFRVVKLADLKPNFVPVSEMKDRLESSNVVVDL